MDIIDELNDENEMRNCHLKNQCNYTYSMYWAYEIEDFPFLYYNYYNNSFLDNYDNITDFFFIHVLQVLIIIH